MSSAKRPPQQRLSPIENAIFITIIKNIINEQVKQNWWEETILNGIEILEFERNLLTEKRALVTLELSNLITGFNDKLLSNDIPK